MLQRSAGCRLIRSRNNQQDPAQIDRMPSAVSTINSSHRLEHFEHAASFYFKIQTNQSGSSRHDLVK